MFPMVDCVDYIAQKTMSKTISTYSKNSSKKIHQSDVCNISMLAERER